MHQGLHDARAVVDPGQQHRLVAEGNPGIGEQAQRFAGGTSDFPGVVEVGVEPQGLVLFQHRHQFRRDAVRQHHRHAAADAHDLDVGDAAQFAENPVEFLIREHQRVTAGKENVANHRRLADVVDAGQQFIFIGNRIDVADLAFAGTVAAVHGADVTDLQQHPVGVAMGHSRHRAVPVLGQGIGQVAGVEFQLPGGGEGLAKDGIVAKALGIDQGEVIGGDRQRKAAQGLFEAGLFLGIEMDAEKLFDAVDIPDGMFQLPAPVLPAGKSDAGGVDGFCELLLAGGKNRQNDLLGLGWGSVHGQIPSDSGCFRNS